MELTNTITQAYEDVCVCVCVCVCVGGGGGQNGSGENSGVLERSLYVVGSVVKCTEGFFLICLFASLVVR